MPTADGFRAAFDQIRVQLINTTGTILTAGVLGRSMLAEQFFETFPQLDVSFSNAWGGVIDTLTRFSAEYGTAFGKRVAYVLGHTGLGVGASRFAADTMLDLLDGRDTQRTRLEMVRRRAVPFPPEPVCATGINLTRYELARSDRNGGKRGLWLKAMDALGLGFDS